MILFAPQGPASELISMSIVLVNAPEIVSLLASISFPYRLFCSRQPPTFPRHAYLKGCL